jgi:tRNA modification GTPase
MPVQNLPRFNLEDTIAALSSGSGPAVRAVVRVSGPGAWHIVRSLLPEDMPQMPEHRVAYETFLVGVPELPPIPATVLVFLGPRSYTGQDLLELHIPGSAPLIEAVLETVLARGARLALPGEFTLRAFLAGKIDLTRAEALLAVLHAQDSGSLHEALQLFAGGLAQPLAAVKERILDLLAEIEASLDFPEEDLLFALRETLVQQCRDARQAMLQLLQRTGERSLLGEYFRVALTGRPNAGKSSLFNALIGKSAALVSPVPGTTRDYLTARLYLDDVVVELVDTAGIEPVADSLDTNGSDIPAAVPAIVTQAQTLRQQQLQRADLVLYCLPINEPVAEEDRKTLQQLAEKHTVLVWTKCDLMPKLLPSPAGEEIGSWPSVATSSFSGQGLRELQKMIVEFARQHTRSDPLAVSLGRCQHHLAQAAEALEQAEAFLIRQEPPELVAVELRNALDELGAVLGEVYTEDLLDRIFSRFCIGK